MVPPPPRSYKLRETKALTAHSHHRAEEPDMNTLQTNTTRVDQRFVVTAIALITVLNVAVIIGLGEFLAWLGENINGNAVVNYLVAVGEALGQ
jgi:nitrate reductase NapE component